MEITWEVEDGYIGGSRPQHTIIPDEELEVFDTEEEKEEFIADWVQEEFESKISWSITSRS